MSANLYSPRFCKAAAATILLFWHAVGCSETAPAQATGAQQGPPAARVQVKPVREGRLRDDWQFLGNVRARARSNLAAGADGTVTRVAVREGDAVKKGAILLEVDLALASARLGVAKARHAESQALLRQAERELARLQGLSEGIIAAQELDQAEARAMSLRAQGEALHATYLEAAALLERHRVRAPYDGIVASRQVDPGDWLQSGQSVLEVVSTGTVEILVDVHPELFGRVKVGETAHLGSGNDEGTVVGIVPALDPASRTMRVRLQVDNPSASLLPGSAVMVRFSVDFSGDGVVVPRDALLREADRVQVVRVADGKAEPLSVEVLATSLEDALVLTQALQVGDSVVTRGNERLRPGQPVQVID